MQSSCFHDAAAHVSYLYREAAKHLVSVMVPRFGIMHGLQVGFFIPEAIEGYSKQLRCAKTCTAANEFPGYHSVGQLIT